MIDWNERKIGKHYFHYGTLSGFGLGFKIDKYGFDFDLIKIYIGIEFR